ncbi:MAG: methyl-coenzyme M reductase I operon protein C [Methanosarcinaceae archaeon]|nr:methyl-coenzyme M reductase I operon protein C [Methanosarcinaceae archaeon]MDD4498668.1 methyl-coenzyme M reductase I operon protein C [Methanosarcinaceae archaeon]
MMFDRDTQVVDCRCGMGLGKGGGLAQRGTLSEAGRSDVVAIAMSPGQRHITKPVCEITYGMRKENIQVSVLVLYSGTGIPESGMRTGAFVISPKEIAQIEMHKLAVIHLGNIKDHVVKKAREILSQADIPAIVVSQIPVDFEDFAEAGVKTRLVMPRDEDIRTKGIVMDMVNGVTRGDSCPRDKLNLIVKYVKSNLDQFEHNKGVV